MDKQKEREKDGKEEREEGKTIVSICYLRHWEYKSKQDR